MHGINNYDLGSYQLLQWYYAALMQWYGVVAVVECGMMLVAVQWYDALIMKQYFGIAVVECAWDHMSCSLVDKQKPTDSIMHGHMEV